MNGKELLKSMIENTGVSGFEAPVAGLIQELFKPYTKDIRSDALGNIIAKVTGTGEGTKPKIMLAGHMDEIGLMVTKIDDKGFLHVTQIGGFDQRTLPAQEVWVHGKKTLLGFVVAKPPHLLSPEERKKTVPLSELLIDIGFSAEKAKELVQVGDLITLKRSMQELQNDWLAGKAMDDRAGVMVMLECLEELKKLKHIADVYAVATVQEEVGMRGAITSTFGIMPDIGIAIDVCHGRMPAVPDYNTSPMGGGPSIAMGPNVHPKVLALIKKVAKENRIPISLSPAPGATGTDAWMMQITQSGVATAVVSIPLRYMHTAVETLSYSDIQQSGKLLAYLIAALDCAFVEELSCY